MLEERFRAQRDARAQGLGCNFETYAASFMPMQSVVRSQRIAASQFLGRSFQPYAAAFMPSCTTARTCAVALQPQPKALESLDSDEQRRGLAPVSLEKAEADGPGAIDDISGSVKIQKRTWTCL